jgi:hypothetical protein
MADAKTLMSLSLKDEASKQLKTFEGNFKKTLRNVEGGDLDLDNSIGKLSSGLGGAGALLGIGGMTAGVALLGNAINDMATKAGQLALVRTAFDNLASGAGQSSDSMLASMRAASLGMVSDYDLIQNANKAMMLGVADTGEELGALLEIARSRGAAMGLSLTQAFGDIVTGLGRESALILDNLGIVIDSAAAMDAYAATLGTTADALDGAQRKQALLNAVMAQSAGMTGGASSGVATAAAQAEAARANADAAGGAFFAPIVREVEQGKAQLFQALTGTYDEFAAKMQNINDVLADAAGDSSVSSQWIGQFTELSDAMTLVGQALAMDVPIAQVYADTLGNIAAQATLTREITDQQANSISTIAALTQDAIKASSAHAVSIQAQNAALDALDPKLERQQALQTAAAKSANLMAMYTDAATDAAARMGGAMAGASAAVDTIRGKLVSAAAGAMGAAKAFAVFQQYSGLTDQVDDLRQGLSNLGYYSADEIDFLSDSFVASKITNVDALIGSFDDLGKTAASTAGGGLSQMEQALNALNGKVASVLGESLSLDPIGVNPSDFLPRPDAVQEDAFRLADVMVNGFASPWASYFESTFPALFQEMAAGGDIQAGAATILQQFQQGMRPELLNVDAIKEKVRAALAMDDAMAGIRDQITAELMGAGASASQVQGALTGVLGGMGLGGGAAPDLTSTGSTAADSFSSGFTATANGGVLMTKISAQMVALVSAFDNPGRQAGTKWGVGFTAVVEQSVPPFLIDMLTRLVTPGVLAAIAARDGAEGAQ